MENKISVDKYQKFCREACISRFKQATESIRALRTSENLENSNTAAVSKEKTAINERQ